MIVLTNMNLDTRTRNYFLKERIVIMRKPIKPDSLISQLYSLQLKFNINSHHHNDKSKSFEINHDNLPSISDYPDDLKP